MTEKEQIDEKRRVFVRGWREAVISLGKLNHNGNVGSDHCDACQTLKQAEVAAATTYPLPQVPRVVTPHGRSYARRVVNGVIEYSDCGTWLPDSTYTAEVIRQLADLLAQPYEP